MRIIFALALFIGIIFAAANLTRSSSKSASQGVSGCRVYTPVCAKKFKPTYDDAGRTESVEIEYEDGAALVLYEKFESAEVSLNSSRGVKTKKILRNFLTKFELEPFKLTVIGHADIAELGLDIDSKGMCSSEKIFDFNIKGGIPISGASNECLAFLRAVNTYELVENEMSITNNSLVEVGYDPSPFMKTTNKLMNGDLYPALLLGSDVEELEKELGIPSDYTHSMVELYPDVQAKLKRYREKYVPRLFAYRSVVIYANRCKDAACENLDKEE